MVALSRLALVTLVLTALQLACHAAEIVDASLQGLLDRYQTEPENAMLCEQIGVAYARLNAFDKAAGFFRRAIALNPHRIASRKNLATVLWFSGQRDESATLFAALEKSIPDDPVPQLYLGLREYQQKNMEAAATHFEHAGSLASDNPETLPVVIETYISAGRAEPASQLLEWRIASGNADAQTYRWLGDAYDAQVQADKAFQAYSEAIKREPKADDHYMALAAFSIEHANPSYAREVLQRGLQQTPGSAKLLLEIGLAWAIQGDFEKARESFANAAAADPEWSVPLLASGVTDLQTGNAEHAAECFRKAKTVAPNDYRCYYLHAVALNRSRNSRDASTRAVAISELRRAIVLDPHRAQSRVALAETEIAAGRNAEAETELREAIRIEPTEPTALYKLALLCRRDGKTEEAERMLRTFRNLKNKSKSEENQFVLILKTVK